MVCDYNYPDVKEIVKVNVIDNGQTNKSSVSLKDFIGNYRGNTGESNNSSMSIVQSGDSYMLTNIKIDSDSANKNIDSKTLKDSDMRSYVDHGQYDDWNCLEYTDSEGWLYQFRKNSRNGQIVVSLSQNGIVELFVQNK